MERHRVLGHPVLRDQDADRVVLARSVQGPQVQHHAAGDDERQQIVQREEAVQRGVVDGRAAAQPDQDRLADDRDGPDQIGDHLCAPVGHLAPRQDVAEEGGGDHQEEDQAADDPDHLARRLVRAVVEAAQHVQIDRDEEHRGPVGVGVADDVAAVDVAHDALDRGEGHFGVGHIVHRQDHAGGDLDHQAESQDAAEGPPVVEVPRSRQRHIVSAEADDRQTGVEPFLDAGLGDVGGFVIAHRSRPQPILMRVSER